MHAVVSMAGRSAAAVSGVVAGLSLVPSPVVAREPRHELLRVFLLDVFEEGGCFSSSQGRRWLAAMNDDHVVAALDVLESVRSRHEYETANARRTAATGYPLMPQGARGWPVGSGSRSARATLPGLARAVTFGSPKSCRSCACGRHQPSLHVSLGIADLRR